MPMLIDAEAAVYAIESAICLVQSASTGNWSQAVLDATSLFGWVKNSIEIV